LTFERLESHDGHLRALELLVEAEAASKHVVGSCMLDDAVAACSYFYCGARAGMHLAATTMSAKALARWIAKLARTTRDWERKERAFGCHAITATNCTRLRPSTCTERLWHRLGYTARLRNRLKWRAPQSAKLLVLLWGTGTVALRSARKRRYVQPPEVSDAGRCWFRGCERRRARCGMAPRMERDDWVRRVALYTSRRAPPSRRNTTTAADDASRYRNNKTPAYEEQTC
jgi:hypothetical protein